MINASQDDDDDVWKPRQQTKQKQNREKRKQNEYARVLISSI